MNEMKVEAIAPMLAGFAILGTVLGMVLRGWSSIKGFVNSAFRLVALSSRIKIFKSASRASRPVCGGGGESGTAEALIVK